MKWKMQLSMIYCPFHSKSRVLTRMAQMVLLQMSFAKLEKIVPANVVKYKITLLALLRKAAEIRIRGNKNEMDMPPQATSQWQYEKCPA